LVTIRVLFVCLGNICRSPTAQGIFQKLVDEQALSEHFFIDSCGTASFNVGKAPDSRAVEACLRHGYDIRGQVARQIHEDDYQRFDYILSMDHQNLRSVQAWAPADYGGEIDLFLRYGRNGGDAQVPDPFYAPAETFDAVVASLERAARGLLSHLRTKHRL